MDFLIKINIYKYVNSVVLNWFKIEIRYLNNNRVKGLSYKSRSISVLIIVILSILFNNEFYFSF